MNQHAYFRTLAIDLAAQRARLAHIADTTSIAILRKNITERDLPMLDMQIADASQKAAALAVAHN